MGELERLKQGNKRFVEGKLSEKDFVGRRAELLEGQKPFATVISCSDSRVVPEYIFDANMGEIFVVRVAGNILDKAVIGSIEYGVGHLKTPLLVVLGHSKCGAVTAACSKHKEGNYIDYIMNKIEPAVKEGDVEESVVENMKCVVEEIQKNSPVVKKAVEEGRLKIVGMKYLLETGEAKETKG